MSNLTREQVEAVVSRWANEAIEDDDEEMIYHVALTDAAQRARIAHLEEALLRSCSDNMEYLQCQPECNRNDHAANCAVAYPRIEYDRLQARIAGLERERDEAVRMMNGVIQQLKIEKRDLATAREALRQVLPIARGFVVVNERYDNTRNMETIRLAEQALASQEESL